MSGTYQNEEQDWQESEVVFADEPKAAAHPGLSHSSCGKAIIVGEHAVVYGAEAIAMPLPSMRVSVRVVKKNSGGPIRLFLDGKVVSDHLRGVVEDALRLLGIKNLSLDVYGNSSVLIGAGLGSSASLCIVILKALAAISHQQLSLQRLAAIGNELEKRFHGNPSGLDTAVVAYEHVIGFNKTDGARPLDLGSLQGAGERSFWPFLLVDSGLRSSTSAMIEVAKPYFAGSQGARRVSRFNDLATQVAEGLRTSNLTAVGAGMNEAHSLLRAAGVAPRRTDEIRSVCREAGALGVKLTGAGGGGCLLVLLDPNHSPEQTHLITEKLGQRHVFPVRLNG